MPLFSDSFFDALGAWQKGWLEKPEIQEPVRQALLLEAAAIPADFKIAPPVLFRKRHLYKVDMVPLVIGKAIDDGACSWTTKRDFADRFKDQWRPEAVTGAILRHVPEPHDIILNIPALWEDARFTDELRAYAERGGVGAQAIYHYRGERDQYEVIATCPLRISEIIRFSGRVMDLEQTIERAGITGEEATELAFKALGASGYYEGSIAKVWDDAAQRVVARVLAAWAERMRELGVSTSKP